MNPEEFYQALKRIGIAINARQKQQFDMYYRLLVHINQQMNLTSVVKRPAVYLKHFYDSITPARYIEGLRHRRLSVCDVGSGAGFPSLPLKIIFPQLTVTIVDALNKRVNFLQRLVQRLGLRHVNLFHARAETFGRKQSKYRETYDLVFARAVAHMSVLSELCLPLVKIGGQFVALKSLHALEDLKRGRYAIRLLGGEVKAVHTFKMPVSADLRRIIVIKKRKKTPIKYPRRAGIPGRRPLLGPNK